MDYLTDFYLYAGCKEEDIAKIREKYDFEKICCIIDSSSSPDEAFEKIHQLYPEIETSAFKEQMNQIRKECEKEAQELLKNGKSELSINELDSIVGGNWKRVLITGVVGLAGAAAIGTIVASIVPRKRSFYRKIRSLSLRNDHFLPFTNKNFDYYGFDYAQPPKFSETPN